jgi:G3E family GTPase
LSIAGAQRRIEAKGFWWVTVPRAHWPRHRQFQELLSRNWSPIWGDRRQELVFIGTGLAEGAMRVALDDCLVGQETGFNPEIARGLHDPLPSWQHDHVHAA